MKSAGKARNDGLYRHIRTSKEIIRNLLNDLNTKIILPHTRHYRTCKKKAKKRLVFILIWID